jgi:glycosyltransferase involved in cell wall biosynthesis
MNLLFISGVFDKSNEKDIIRNSYKEVQFAANNFQWNLIYGMHSLKDINLNPIYSAQFIGSYPLGYNKIKIMEQTGYYNELQIKYVKFINIWGVRHISRYNNLKASISDSEISKLTHVLVYSTHSPFLKFAFYIKKINPNVKLSVIIPDLPEYTNLRHKKSTIYKILKMNENKNIYKMLKDFNSYIILTKHMNEYLRSKESEYLVVEGIIRNEEINTKKSNDVNNEDRFILYSGTLNREFGIIKLIDWFKKYNKEGINLLICGTGDSKDYVLQAVRDDSRIKYLGQISNSEVKILQKKATILINPRNSRDAYTRFSFPSKTLEYLTSLTPIVCFKLPGIPDEYDEVLFYTNDYKEKLTYQVEKILTLNKNELFIYETKVLNILKNKTSEIVARKIIEFIR